MNLIETFASEHQLPYEHHLIPAKRGVIALGNPTKDTCFAAVLGLTVDSHGLLHWDKDEKGIGLPKRTLDPLVNAGCQFDPAGYFCQQMRTAVIEFDPTSETQAAAIIKFLGVPKRRTGNAEGLKAYRAKQASVTPENQPTIY